MAKKANSLPFSSQFSDCRGVYPSAEHALRYLKYGGLDYLSEMKRGSFVDHGITKGKGQLFGKEMGLSVDLPHGQLGATSYLTQVRFPQLPQIPSMFDLIPRNLVSYILIFTVGRVVIKLFYGMVPQSKASQQVILGLGRIAEQRAQTYLAVHGQTCRLNAVVARNFAAASKQAHLANREVVQRYLASAEVQTFPPGQKKAGERLCTVYVPGWVWKGGYFILQRV